MHATSPVHLMLLVLIFLFIFGEEYNYEDPHYAVFFNLLLLHPCSDILSTLFPDTFSLCSPNIRVKVSHPYKATGKMIDFGISVCMFSDSKQKDKMF
jgi:hypothetical protein